LDDVWDVESVFVGKRGAKKPLVRRLAVIIELRPQRVTEFSKQTARIILLEHGKTRKPLVDEIRENFKIDLHQFVHSGLAHLEHHLAAIGKPRGMHLPDGCAPQRLHIEGCEELVGRCAQVFSNNVGDGFHGQLGDFVLQLRKFRTICVRQ